MQLVVEASENDDEDENSNRKSSAAFTVVLKEYFEKEKKRRRRESGLGLLTVRIQSAEINVQHTELRCKRVTQMQYVALRLPCSMAYARLELLYVCVSRCCSAPSLQRTMRI